MPQRRWHLGRLGTAIGVDTRGRTEVSDLLMCQMPYHPSGTVIHMQRGQKWHAHTHLHASQPWHALANHTKLLERDLWQGPPSDLLGHLLLPSSAWWKWWTVLWPWIKRYYRFQTSLKIVVIHLGRIYCSTQCFLFLFWAKFLEWTLCHLTVCTGVLEACGTIWCWTIHD